MDLLPDVDPGVVELVARAGQEGAEDDGLVPRLLDVRLCIIIFSTVAASQPASG